MTLFTCLHCGYQFQDIAREGYVSAECPECKSWDTRSSRMITLDSNIIQHNTYAWNKDLDRDNHRKEIIQPTTKQGHINEDFEKAYGYNPYKTKSKPFRRQQQLLKQHSQENIEKQIETEKKLPMQSLSTFKH